MKGIIKIKNITDVITNSSSEVFIVKSDKPKLNLKDIVKNHHKDHYWSGAYELDNVPNGLKWILTDELIETVKENCNESSGMAGDCEVYNWEDGYEWYKRHYKKPNLTPEQWAKCLGKSLDDLQSVIVVDIDWCCRATINMLKERFNIINECDDTYDNFYYEQFRHDSRYEDWD